MISKKSILFLIFLNLEANTQNIKSYNQDVIKVNILKSHLSNENCRELQRLSSLIKETQKGKNDIEFWKAISLFSEHLFFMGNYKSAFNFQALVIRHHNLEMLSQVEYQNKQIRIIASYCLIPTIFIFSFFVFVFYRSRREMLFQEEKLTLKYQVSEIEIKALRSQMNPHFIFNCMNSIYHYMQQENLELASHYLISFSRLIRLVLENSNHKEVSLEDDLTALELYIQMEQLRLDNTFKYKIEISSQINQKNVFIPPLILQPFVENAIWHGLNNRKTNGILEIKIEMVKEMLKCIITDNGIDIREKTLAFNNDLNTKMKKTSMGISLTRERINLLNKSNNKKADFKEFPLFNNQKEYLGRQIEVFLALVTDEI